MDFGRHGLLHWFEFNFGYSSVAWKSAPLIRLDRPICVHARMCHRTFQSAFEGWYIWGMVVCAMHATPSLCRLEWTILLRRNSADLAAHAIICCVAALQRGIQANPHAHPAR
jgi:hypothetical protein